MPHPTDHLSTDLLATYGQAIGRLEGIVQDGLRRGLKPDRLGTAAQEVGDATVAYRQRQLAQARELLTALDAQAGRVGPLVVGRAYSSGVVAIDRTVGSTRIAGSFGRVHVRAVEALAAGMTESLRSAIATTGQNVADVFARADALEGGLPRDGRVADVPFIGRRIDDPYRAFALETIAQGTIGLDTRREVSSELARKLVTEGVTDATTGFVDRSGTRWDLRRYTAMVARTTTREATTRGTAERMVESGLDLVTISSHDHIADECSPWDGGTFSLTGKTAGYDVVELPPYHPNCEHVATPASEDLDAFERELEAAASGAPAAERTGSTAAGRSPGPPPGNPAPPPTPPAVPPANPIGAADRAQAAADAVRAADAVAGPGPDLGPRPANHGPDDPFPDYPVANVDGLLPFDEEPHAPFGGAPDPRSGSDTARILEAQRVRRLIDADPGMPRDQRAAMFADLEQREPELAAQARGERRQREADLDLALGDALARETKKAFARDLELREELLAGRTTVADVERAISAHYSTLDARRQIREDAKSDGFRTGPCNCDQCGQWKAKPADICDHCGADPITGLEYHGAAGAGSGEVNRLNAATEFNRSHGYRY